MLAVEMPEPPRCEAVKENDQIRLYTRPHPAEGHRGP